MIPEASFTFATKPNRNNTMLDGPNPTGAPVRSVTTTTPTNFSVTLEGASALSRGGVAKASQF
jgi:hypothetical protein